MDDEGEGKGGVRKSMVRKMDGMIYELMESNEAGRHVGWRKEGEREQMVGSRWFERWKNGLDGTVGIKRGGKRKKRSTRKERSMKA